MQVKCRYSTLGCHVTDKLKNMDDHVVSCSNVEIQCKLNCKEKIKHIDHEKHVKYDCLNREYTCKFCQYKSTYSKITGQTVLVMIPCNAAPFEGQVPPEKGHYAQCPGYPKTCPNECGMTIQRKLMQVHRTACPKEIIRCNVFSWWDRVQCNEVMERQLLASHRQYECLHRGYICQFCSIKSSYTKITGETEMKRYDPSSVPNPKQDAILNPPPEKGHYAQCPDYPKTCPNECGTTTKRKCMQEHLATCARERVECELGIGTACDLRFKCNEVMERQFLAKHCQFECIYRKYTCQFCDLESTYTEVTGETEMKKYNPSSVSNTEYNAMINPPPERGHYAQCEKYPMHCPNSCSKEVILRQDMPSHRQQCPLEPVECPFREAGCEVKLVRKELEGHVTNSITKHLTGLLEAFMETRKELMETKIALAETQARLPPQKK